MNGSQPQHKYYLRKDRFGDTVCAVEVLGAAENQGIVRVRVCTINQEEVTEYRQDLLGTSEFCPAEAGNFEEIRAALLPMSYWIAEVADPESIACMLRGGNTRYRTNDQQAAKRLEEIGEELGIPAEVIVCDWPSYEWEGHTFNSIDLASRIWADALLRLKSKN